MSVQQAHWMPDNDNGTHTQTHTDCWRRHNQCKNVRITHWTRSPRAERDWARSESVAPDYRALHRHRNYKTSIWCALDSAHRLSFSCALLWCCKVHWKKGEAVAGEGERREKEEEKSDKTTQKKRWFLYLYVCVCLSVGWTLIFYLHAQHPNAYLLICTFTDTDWLTR